MNSNGTNSDSDDATLVTVSSVASEELGYGASSLREELHPDESSRELGLGASSLREELHPDQGTGTSRAVVHHNLSVSDENDVGDLPDPQLEVPRPKKIENHFKERARSTNVHDFLIANNLASVILSQGTTVSANERIRINRNRGNNSSNANNDSSSTSH